MDGSRGERRSRGADARGQMAPLGVALLLSIVIFGSLAIVVFGGTALEQTEDRTQVQRAEHVLTLFDSRTAMVALGDSDTQTTSLVGSGTYTVDDSSGRIRMVHVDYNSTNDEEIYNDTMGALVSETGDTEVVYQGGGVWRKESTGRTRMVTPPEFHFRQSTLTFPLVHITNSDSAAGPVDARVDASDRAVPIYPNQTESYEVGSESYRNPLENGTVVVYVQSEYYEGWAEYFRTRTEANVTEYSDNQTVKANLLSLGPRGEFDMPEEGNSIPVRGISDGHSLSEFRINITDSETDADMNNLQWSMFVTQGNKQLELGISNDGGGDPCNETARVSLYYSPDSGATQHAWQDDDAFTIECGDIDGDGEEDAYVEVDFTSDSVNLTYQSDGDFKSKGLVEYRNDHKSSNVPDSITWDDHDSVSYEEPPSPISFSDGDEMTVDDTVNHYFGLLDDEFHLVVNDQQGGNGNGGGAGADGSVSEMGSGGYIDYPGNAKYIAYLHVTRNDVEVEFQ